MEFPCFLLPQNRQFKLSSVPWGVSVFDYLLLWFGYHDGLTATSKQNTIFLLPLMIKQSESTVSSPLCLQVPSHFITALGSDTSHSTLLPYTDLSDRSAEFFSFLIPIWNWICVPQKTHKQAHFQLLAPLPPCIICRGACVPGFCWCTFSQSSNFCYVPLCLSFVPSQFSVCSSNKLQPATKECNVSR